MRDKIVKALNKALKTTIEEGYILTDTYSKAINRRALNEQKQVLYYQVKKGIIFNRVEVFNLSTDELIELTISRFQNK